MTLTRIEDNGQPYVLISRENTVTGFVAAGTDRITWMMRPRTLRVVSAACHVSARELIRN